MAFTTRHTVLGRIRTGEELGWEEFVAIYKPLIRLRGRDRGLDDGEADDLVQDVLLEIFKGNVVVKFDPDRGCRFRDYLKVIIDRCAFKVIGKRQKRVVPLGDEADAVDQAPAAADVFEERWNATWRKHTLRQAEQAVKRHVKPDAWRVFMRTVLEGAEPRAVAEELGMSVNNVYVTKHRVLGRMREAVEQLEGER